MYFIIAATTILLVWHHGGPRILGWLAPWAVIAVFLKLSLRPEPLAVALMMAGYTLQLRCRKAGAGLWLAFFLIFVGTSVAPRTALFGATLAGVSAWQWLQAPAFARRSFFLLSAGALACAGLIFMILIRFKFTDFYHAFHMHSARVDEGGIIGALKIFGIMKWSLMFLLAVTVLGLSLGRVADEAAGVSYSITATFILVVLGRAFGPGVMWHLVFVVFVLTAAMSSRLRPSLLLALEGALAIVFIAANSSLIIEQFGIFTGNIVRQKTDNFSTILALRPTKERLLVLDVSVARYVYDYRIPPNCVDFGFAAPFPGLIPIDAKLQPEDTFLVGPNTASLLYDDLHSDFSVERWSPLHRKDRSFIKYPCQAFIIPAQKCIEIIAQNRAAKK